MASSAKSVWDVVLQELGTYNTLRIIAPGSILLAFLLWRYPNASGWLASSNPAIMIVVLIVAIFTLGVTWYAIHRTLMRYGWRRLELRLHGVPQLRFHEHMLNEQNPNEKIRKKVLTLRAAEDCYANVLKKAQDRREILLLNSLVHILLMNSELAVFFLILDVIVQQMGYQVMCPLIGGCSIVIWAIILFIIFAVFGVGLDREADEKEVAILREMSDAYRVVLTDYIDYLD